MNVTVIETVTTCPKCMRELIPEDYLCEACGYCQYCCNCSEDTPPEATLPGD